MTKVAVYAICKNEIKFVDKFYESVRFADYIVVLDTGSTDGTYEAWLDLAKKDAKIIVEQKVYSEWRFDVARNDAMDMCPTDTDVFFSLDLDERLYCRCIDELRNNWKRGVHQRAEYWYVWSHNPDGSDGRKFMYNKVHTKNWRWRYPVHEILYNIDTDLEVYVPDVVLRMSDEFVVKHYPDNTKSRGSYLGLLQKRSNEYGDYLGQLYLGHEYYYNGMYEQCIRQLRTVAEAQGCGELERASCWLFIGDAYRATGNYDAAHNAYLVSMSAAPYYFEPYFYCAEMFYELKNYEKCITLLESGLKYCLRSYSWLEREKPWYSCPWDLLSIAYYHVGNLGKSLQCMAKALSIEPQNERLQNNLKLVLNKLTNKQLIEGV